MVSAGEAPDPVEQIAVLDDDTTWGQMLEVPVEATVRYIRVETTASAVPFGWLEIDVITG